MEECVFVLNDIEKRLAQFLIGQFESGDFPLSRKTHNTNDVHSEISYEYCSTKQEKILRGFMLDCRYKLRYRDKNHIFFSAWDCKDVCSVFYDVMSVVQLMIKSENPDYEAYQPFEVDFNTKGYVFFTGQIARSFVDMTEHLDGAESQTSYSSQYMFSVFSEPEYGVYNDLIEKFKAEGYSHVRILQLWIRGEILYYVIADGVVLRPEHQRSPNVKEEADLIRKIYKATNSTSRFMDFNKIEYEPDVKND